MSRRRAAQERRPARSTPPRGHHRSLGDHLQRPAGEARHLDRIEDPFSGAIRPRNTSSSLWCVGTGARARSSRCRRCRPSGRSGWVAAWLRLMAIRPGVPRAGSPPTAGRAGPWNVERTGVGLWTPGRHSPIRGGNGSRRSRRRGRGRHGSSRRTRATRHPVAVRPKGAGHRRDEPAGDESAARERRDVVAAGEQLIDQRATRSVPP